MLFGIEDGRSGEIRGGDSKVNNNNNRDVLGKKRQSSFGKVRLLSLVDVYGGEGLAEHGLASKGTSMEQNRQGGVGSSEKTRIGGCNTESSPVIVEEFPMITRSRARAMVAATISSPGDLSEEADGGGCGEGEDQSFFMRKGFQEN
ncbi:hypothetical protein VNO80_22706 [Phaseolus coccineus]|uniref:Uncharacterized protein n=1 Tax=Phaseolus coccineus TaxID=3886 RepID=A0AAN9MA68_PHACN